MMPIPHANPEAVMAFTRREFGKIALAGLPAATLLETPLFGALGLFMLVFLWRELDSRGARTALLASIGLLACAVALDFVEGLPRAHPWNVIATWSRDAGWKAFTMEQFGRPGFDALRHFAKALEEFIEMLAQTILWAALILRLGGHAFLFRR
jgi:hypothetical protein